MMPKPNHISRPGTECGLSRNDDLIPATFDRFAQNFLGSAIRIDVSRIKHVQTCLQGNVHQFGCFFDFGNAKGADEIFLEPNVPVPRQSAGTLNPEPPSCLNSMM